MNGARGFQAVGALILVWVMSVAVLFVGLTSPLSRPAVFVYPVAAGAGFAATLLNRILFKKKPSRLGAISLTIVFLAVAVVICYLLLLEEETPFEAFFLSIFAGFFTVGVTADYIRYRKFKKRQKIS